MHKTIVNFYLRNFLIVNFCFSILLTGVVAPKVAAAGTCTLSFAISGTPATAVGGENITRTFTVKNAGRTSCRNVSYSVFYSPDEQFVSATPVPRAGNYYFYVGTLGIGKQAKSVITTKATASAGELRTEACAAANNALDTCAVSVVPITSLASPVISEPAPSATSTSPEGFAGQATTSTNMQSTNPTKEKGMWIWEFPSVMNSVNGEAQLKAIAQDGFNAVYITVDDYLEIAALPEGAAKHAAKSAYFLTLSQFVTKAKNLSLAVDAEGGANNWAFPSNRWKGFALIDMAKEYNALYPNAKLRGFQYDVEPHTLSDYETNKTVRLAEFVTFIDQSVSRMIGSDLELIVVTPHFFDDAQEWTPQVNYNGTSAHTFNHLLAIMEKKRGSKITLMSYRDFFDGANGTREISEVEMRKASEGYSTKVIVAQETGNVDPAFVTFHGSTKTRVLEEVKTIDAYFSKYANYGGAAVHYIDPYLAMPKE